MKSVVAAAAREAGWEAVLEQAAPDRSWIADVMVTRGTDPASPWQRACNENANGLLRQYFRMGADLSTVGPS